MVYTSISEIFEAFKHLKVLIIGDSMVDTYTYGAVHRMSPEAPVPVLSSERTEHRLGGAANVALNIASLGAKPILCSVIGHDLSGANLIELCLQHHLDPRFIVESKVRPTTVKHRMIAGGQQLLRVDDEVTDDLSAIDQAMLWKHISAQLPTCDVVILQDYDKGCLFPDMIEMIVSEAKAANKPVVVDPKFKNFSKYKDVTLFKPNAKEFDAAVPGTDLPLAERVAQWREDQGIAQCLLTRSGDGVLYDSQEDSGCLPARLREVADVSGAGDTVLSIAALCQAIHLPLRFTAELANLGGGIVCEHFGVVPLSSDRLMAEAAEDLLLLGMLRPAK
ncbi:bifunctional heptose 7-phosphate kinase/heptose 1-phosphate adenyltransferase [Marinoscillum furvescens]|uniref:RfaE bifunctional protein kinase chain/domain n=1 Tax=Marinoscillum furvescens DSM 4134 TaxID=1122208 RepID=A0A3D9L4B7_MARFU|nr:bifunctional ADP-heptose synthase [Marinoscillum furvescens]RED99777.1 rfaE bifunctional protein kinase chain/domain [Marinoscillum furvescens DSM 4134]